MTDPATVWVVQRRMQADEWYHDAAPARAYSHHPTEADALAARKEWHGEAVVFAAPAPTDPLPMEDR